MARERKRARFGGESQQIDPLDTGDGAPVDIASIRHDDALIDAIASDGPVATDSPDEYQLATLLASWRAAIVTPPLPAGPELDDIVSAVNQEIGARAARVSAGSRLRLVRPIAGAAAAVALIVGGMTAFSYNAQPGDPLWKVKQVVFSNEADSTMANTASTSDLQEAERLISNGDVKDAQAHVDRAAQRTGDVTDSTKRTQLQEWVSRLKQQVEAQLTPSTTPRASTTATSPSPVLPTTSPAEVPPAQTWTGNPPSNGGPSVDQRTAMLLPPGSTTAAVSPPDTTKPDTSAMPAPQPSSENSSTTTQVPPKSTTKPAESHLPMTKTVETPTG